MQRYFIATFPSRCSEMQSLAPVLHLAPVLQSGTTVSKTMPGPRSPPRFLEYGPCPLRFHHDSGPSDFFQHSDLHPKNTARPGDLIQEALPKPR